MDVEVEVEMNGNSKYGDDAGSALGNAVGIDGKEVVFPSPIPARLLLLPSFVLVSFDSNGSLRKCNSIFNV
jgi:hypothetical protein